MIKRLLLLSIIIVSAAGISRAQIGTGGVYGTIVDDKGEPIPFANVAILQSGQLVTGSTTDFDGQYKIKSLKPGGDYTIKASVVGFTAQERTGVVIKAGQNSEVKFEMSAGVKLDEVQVVAYVVPLIEKDGGSNTTITGADIE